MQAYADAEDIKNAAKGMSLRSSYADDIVRQMKARSINTYRGVVQFAMEYAAAVIDLQKRQGVELNTSGKHCIIYEITAAVKLIVPSIDQRKVFEEMTST